MPSPSSLIIHKGDPLTPQSAATRARIIKTAELLFSDRGIERVTVHDINLAAGQKNKNATHYHFGDKRGLLQAILDKHQPGIIRRRDELLDEVAASGDRSTRAIVRALLYPVAEKLFDGDGGREFIRIAAELSSTYAAALNGAPTSLMKLAEVARLTAVRKHHLGHLPEAVAEQRVRLAVSLILNGIADQSRILDAAEAERGTPAADTELLIRNLEDCLVAMCEAPVSAPCAEALRKASAAPSRATAGAGRERAPRRAS